MSHGLIMLLGRIFNVLCETTASSVRKWVRMFSRHCGSLRQKLRKWMSHKRHTQESHAQLYRMDDPNTVHTDIDINSDTDHIVTLGGRRQIVLTVQKSTADLSPDSWPVHAHRLVQKRLRQ